MTSRKRGRPCEPDGMRRDVFLKIRVSREELAMTEKRAAKMGKSVSDFARQRLGLAVSGYGERRKTATQPAPAPAASQPVSPPAPPSPTPAQEAPISLAQMLPWR